MTSETDFGSLPRQEKTVRVLEIKVRDLELAYADLNQKLQFMADASNILSNRVTELDKQYRECLQQLIDTRAKLVELETPVICGFGEVKPHEVRGYSEVKFAGFPTLGDLVANIELIFECRNGDYSAYATEHHRLNQEGAYRYRTIRYITANPDRPYERLRIAVWQHLCSLADTVPASRPVLYWRYAIQERIHEFKDPASDRWQIRTRVALPEADWSKYPGVEEGANAPEIP